MNTTVAAAAEKAASQLKSKFQSHVQDLKDLVRIPSVSFSGFDPKELGRSAEATAALFKRRGLENVRLLEVPGAPPYVYADWLHAPGKPTVLLYAHHDVQPPGRDELWVSPAFEPTVRAGHGGDRLFGRGSSDDKSGIILHSAAVSAYLEATGSLPVNVKVVIEGEEEVGSRHLSQFLKTYRSLLDADVMVLADAGNFDCGVPALTVALRGIVGVEVEVRALTKTVHSGEFGGPVPDPAMALCRMLAGLVGEDGRIAIPGVREQVRPLSKEEEEEIRRIPFDEKAFREGPGMLPGTKILQEGPSPVAQTWRFPSLTVNAIQASSRKQAGNVINDSAWAKVTIRLVPDMNPERVLGQLTEFLRARVPWGLEASFKTESCSGPWLLDAHGRAGEVLAAAERALERGYGKKPLRLGSGGSIPFVGSLSAALGGAPALLVGAADPFTAAHGENESVLLSDLEKACLAQIHLFAELAG